MAATPAAAQAPADPPAHRAHAPARWKGAAVAFALVAVVAVTSPGHGMIAGAAQEPPVAWFTSTPPGGPVNVALDLHGATAHSASSQSGGSTAANVLTQDDYAPYWRTLSAANEWAIVDLGAVHRLTTVALGPGLDPTMRPQHVRVLAGSDAADPTTFTAIVDGAMDNSTDATSWNVAAGQVAARYLRVELLDAWSPTATALVLGSLRATSGDIGAATVTFADESVNPDTGGTITSRLWDFGDGSTSTDQSPTHTYAAPGTYTVRLTVTDSENETSFIEASQSVIAPPTVDFGPLTGATESGAHYITVTLAEPDRRIVSWVLDQGDGTEPVTFSSHPLGAAQFVGSGTYTVTVAVTDTYGTVGTISHTITVANEDPYIWSYHPDPYALGYDVPWVPDIGFADPSSQDTDNLSCHWDYGDGTTRAIPPPCSIDEAVEPHMYTLGTFAPTLTVSDPDGATVTHTDHVTVSPARTYISLYAVAGSASAGQITVRAKLWNADAWTEMPGQPIEFTVGTHAVTVTTDASGVAEVRIDRLPGQDATAVFPGTSTHQTGSDTTDLARYGLPQGDIIFTADESGSMHFIATALRTNLTFMASQLAASLDYQLGLMGFGSSAHFLPQLHLPATDSLADFDAAASQLRSDGGIEPGIDAIGEAVQPRVGLRPEAAACVVLIGDEHAQQENWTVPRAEQALADADATLFAIITPDPTTQAYSDLAVGSGGAVFDIQDFRQDPGPILSALLTRCVASVTERPDLAVDVTDNVAVTGPGVGQTVAVTVRNDGQADASGVVVRTTVRGPASVTSVSDGGTATSLAGGRTEVVWNLNSLSAGDTRHLAIEIAVDGTAANGDVLRYEADVADDGTLGADLTPDNNTDVDTTDVVREPPEPELDLAVTITDHVATVRPGAGATADVEVTNPSNRDAQGVELTVTVTGPISITSVSDGGTATPLASGGFRVTWPAFDLPVFAPGEPRSFAVAVDGSAQGGDIVRYVAEISVPGTVAQDTNPDNDTAEDTTVVVARPDIAVTVDDGETQLRAGDAATVRIEATNVGTVHVTAVTMTVTVTGPLTITSVSDGGTFAALLGGGYRVTWPAFDLLAGGVERRTIEVTVDGSAQDGASAAYDASVSDDGVHGEDLALANNTSHDTTGIIAPDAIPSTTPGTTPSTTPSPAPSTTPPTTPPISPSSTPGASTPLVPLETPGTPSANSPDPLDDDEEQEQDQDTEALPDTGAGALGTRVAWSVALAGFGLMLALGTRRRWHTG